MPARLRAALSGSEVVVAPAGFNALSCRLVAEAGFPAVVLGGSTVCNTLLGLPDAGFVSLTEMEFVLVRAAAVCPIPIIVDIDTGFGNALHVAHTIRVLERAGAAGFLLEDQGSSKRSGHVAGKSVVSLEEMVGKLHAAKDARRDSDIVLIARTDSRGVEGPDSAIARCNAYVAAGADGYFADGLLSNDEIAQFAKAIEAPFPCINLGGAARTATTPKPALSSLAEMGYRGVLIGVDLLRAEALAGYHFLKDLRERGTDAARDLRLRLEGTPLADWYSFTGFGQVRSAEERYLPARETAERYEGAQPGLFEPDPEP